jgi:hypothetical protein
MDIKLRKTAEGYNVLGNSGIGHIEDLRRFKQIVCKTYEINAIQWAELKAALAEIGAATFQHSLGKFEQMNL